MRRFEQVISKNKVSSNTVSPPCKVKAQTVAWCFCTAKILFDIFPCLRFVTGTWVFVLFEEMNV